MNRYTNNPKRLRRDIIVGLLQGGVVALIGYFAITNLELFISLIIIGIITFIFIILNLEG